MTGNREYKSDVFSMLMEDPHNALDVYNALNGTDYRNPNDVEMVYLEKGISLSMRNDASFVIDCILNLYEHQATFNPNMPTRSLIYFVNIIEPMVRNRDLYGRRPVLIPTPHFVVFYNGMENRPEVEELYLSDVFIHKSDRPELELKCTIYNINHGCNIELLERCNVLKEYMILVDKVRENLKRDVVLEHALTKAIDECIAEHVLEDFLKKRRDEVIKMTTLDYTWERREQMIRRDEREEGMSQGLSQGLSLGLEALVHTLKEFFSTPEEIFTRVIKNPEYSDVTLEQIEQLF